MQGFEDFWNEAAQCNYAEILSGHNVGFPLVHIDCSFSKPFRFGENLRLEIDIARLGNRSVSFRFRLGQGEDPEVRAELERGIEAVRSTTLEIVETNDILAETARGNDPERLSLQQDHRAGRGTRIANARIKKNLEEPDRVEGRVQRQRDLLEDFESTVGRRSLLSPLPPRGRRIRRSVVFTQLNHAETRSFQ